jgi:hypothetical protein
MNFKSMLKEAEIMQNTVDKLKNNTYEALSHKKQLEIAKQALPLINGLIALTLNLQAEMLEVKQGLYNLFPELTQLNSKEE